MILAAYSPLITWLNSPWDGTCCQSKIYYFKIKTIQSVVIFGSLWWSLRYPVPVLKTHIFPAFRVSFISCRHTKYKYHYHAHQCIICNMWRYLLACLIVSGQLELCVKTLSANSTLKSHNINESMVLCEVVLEGPNQFVVLSTVGTRKGPIFQFKVRLGRVNRLHWLPVGVTAGKEDFWKHLAVPLSLQTSRI